jgi:hypothetical protein
MGKGEEGVKLKLGKLKAEMEDGENVLEMQPIFRAFLLSQDTVFLPRIGTRASRYE